LSSKDKPKNYELILEGLENRDQQTLQKVKGILIGNLELSIPEVQKILESYPLTIKRSENESELSVHYSALKAAGAKVLLLKEGSGGESPSNEIEFTLDTPPLLAKETAPEKTEPGPVSQEIEFELDFESVPSSPPKEEAKPAATYELNLTEDADLKELEKEFGESLQITGQEKETSAPQPTEDFSLDLQPAAGGLDLIESPALANTPADSGSWEADRLSASLVAEAYNSSEQNENIPENTSQISKIEESLLELEASEKPLQTPPATPVQAPPPKKEAPPIMTLDKPAEIATPVTPAAPVQPAVPPPQVAAKEPVKAEVKTIPAPVTAAMAPPPPAPKKKGIPADLLIPILVGGLLLGAVNWYYFTSKQEEKNSVVPKIIIPELLEPEAQKKEEVPEAPAFGFNGNISNEKFSASVKLSASIDKVHSFSLEFSGTKPADLSSEEIVQGLAPRIWLRKGEAENLNFTKNESGTFSAKGPVKLYFEQGEKRERIIAEGEFSIIPDKETLKIQVAIEHNDKLSPENENFAIEVKKTDSAAAAPLNEKPLTLPAS
jgi:hypothetical protein